MSKTKQEKEYPPEFRSAASKRLYDEGLIKPASVIKQLAEGKLEVAKATERKKLIKGYKLNPFNNRRARRLSARQSGYLRRDESGENKWWMFRATPENNVQTVVKK